MDCCIEDLTKKEVIDAKTGCRMGFVCDVEVDTCTGCVKAIIVWGKSRCFGIFGRNGDLRIPWQDVTVVGDDTVLVCTDAFFPPPKQRGKFFDDFFRR